jgi:hypothetical protein
MESRRSELRRYIAIVTGAAARAFELRSVDAVAAPKEKVDAERLTANAKKQLLAPRLRPHELLPHELLDFERRVARDLEYRLPDKRPQFFPQYNE